MSTTAAYRESRRHELRKNRIVMVDGNLAVNTRNVDAGTSERVHAGGYWGFASASGAGGDASALRDVAFANARAMARFGPRADLALPGGSHRGEHAFRARRRSRRRSASNACRPSTPTANRATPT